ncbi:hypothetical protein PVL29_002928 [Vitis rotundifolia]|uniref:GDSL esterase/lipase n=1 Tax=Vitis rotundifolia TaxID=103349 RepID=A0AA39E2A1_VITRO|nr:hypothetical protein PVL29_002928 [Vitis rotundifolia]
MAERWVPSLSFFLVMVVLHSADASIPAMFILGDSTADVGTNSLLPFSFIRADFPYNGIDFPSSKPTGRFSNGFNTVDFLANLTGFQISPPPFLSLLNSQSSMNKQFLKGVSFASGGSGLLNTTGQFLGVIPLGKQIQQFATVQSNLTAAIGSDETEKLLSKSLFLISTGGNDILGHFPFNGGLTKEEFIKNLSDAYDNHLKNLFELGARKFAIVGVPPIGCCPLSRLADINDHCHKEMNEYARDFQTTLSALLQKLSSEYGGMKYSLGNAYEMTMNVIDDPPAFNLKDVKSACCGGGRLNASLPCLKPFATVCSNRDDYLFWDLVHPTQHVSKLAAQTLYSGPPRLVSPINFSQLVENN